MTTTVAIGMFDGVHRGHRFLLERLHDIAVANGTQPAVVTFDRHPLAVIHPERCPKLLCSLDERLALIRNAGIERVEVIPFDNELRSLTASEFCKKILCPALNPSTILLGYDHGFGSDRLNTPAAYAEALGPLGIDIRQCPPYPDGEISSSLVRQSLERGDVVAAARMLGRPYRIEGTVVHGKQLGRTIGFPTANIAVPDNRLIPANGVYAGSVANGPAEIAGKLVMVNIGTAPTVNGANASQRTVEAYIIGADTDLYGQQMAIDLTDRIRDERRFASLDKLRDAIAADVATVLRPRSPIFVNTGERSLSASGKADN